MSDGDVYITCDRGRVLIYAREPGVVTATEGFEVLPWDALYSPETWRNDAGFSCYMVRTRRDMLQLVTGGYCSAHTTPEERKELVADFERRAEEFGLKYGDNWEPIIAGWGAPTFKQIPV